MEADKITVLGSVNWDTFVLIERPPEIGETITSNTLKTACGGKGANQAVTIGKQGFKVDFVGQFGSDSFKDTISSQMKKDNVNLDKTSTVSDTPTGQAYIFSYPNKDNSIIVVGGANMDWSKNNLEGLKESISTSKFLVLQREIPEEINVKACKIAKESGVKIILDMGGADTPLTTELLSLLDIISPNKTELRRILNREINTKDKDELIKAVEEMRTISKNASLCLLLKRGSKGCLFIDKQNNIYEQDAFKLPDMPIVDTTGAGDCFTASFVTQYMQGKPIKDVLEYSSAAAYICITRFGAMPSLPTREEIDSLLKKIK
jgi:ribokinase